VTRSGQADDPLAAQVLGEIGRGQPALGRRQALQMLQDQGRIHQHHALVGHQAGRLDRRVDGGEVVEIAEHRQLFGLERQAHQFQRNRHPPHIGRVPHPDQPHQILLQPGQGI
jgi:hypothetical protein